MSFGFSNSVPFSQCSGHFPPVAPHLGHSLIKLLQTAAYYLAYFGAGRLPGAFFGNHTPDLIESEANCLRAFNEIQPFEYLFAVEPVTGFGPRGAVEESTPLINPQALDAHSVPLVNFTHPQQRSCSLQACGHCPAFDYFPSFSCVLDHYAFPSQYPLDLS